MSTAFTLPCIGAPRRLQCRPQRTGDHQASAVGAQIWQSAPKCGSTAAACWPLCSRLPGLPALELMRWLIIGQRRRRRRRRARGCARDVCATCARARLVGHPGRSRRRAHARVSALVKRAKSSVKRVAACVSPAANHWLATGSQTLLPLWAGAAGASSLRAHVGGRTPAHASPPRRSGASGRVTRNTFSQIDHHRPTSLYRPAMHAHWNCACRRIARSRRICGPSLAPQAAGCPAAAMATGKMTGAACPPPARRAARRQAGGGWRRAHGNG